MNIKSTTRAITQAPVKSSSNDKKAKLDADLKIPADATVTYDEQKDCFHFEGSGTHRGICRENALVDGLKVAAVVAIPAFIGAAENQLVGTLAAGLGGTYTGVLGGLMLGGAIGGYQSYKGSNNNPVYGMLGGLGGALAGAVAFPVLKQPGLWGGYTGAAVATGLAAGAAFVYQAVQNHKVTEAARAHGWQG